MEGFKRELSQLFESQKGLEAGLEQLRGEDRPKRLEDLAAERQRLLELEAACHAAERPVGR